MLHFSPILEDQAGSSPRALTSTGLPVPKPELIAQLEQGGQLWALGLTGEEEPEVSSSCSTGESAAADWVVRLTPTGAWGISPTAVCTPAEAGMQAVLLPTCVLYL